MFDLDSMDARFSERVSAPIPAPYLHSIALIERKLFDQVKFDAWYAGNSWREETDFYLAASAAGCEGLFLSKHRLLSSAEVRSRPSADSA